LNRKKQKRGDNLSRKEKIQKMATRTASQARQLASKDRKRSERSTKASGTKPHRHCSVCWAPIPLDSDPPVCDSEECEKTNEKREKSRKRLTVMLYLFPAIAILLAIMSTI
tara:strand:+ start:37397 stop:37729 length:333 start_codon:yes stop_codon:yes gene_type:complete